MKEMSDVSENGRVGSSKVHLSTEIPEKGQKLSELWKIKIFVNE